MDCTTFPLVMIMVLCNGDLRESNEYLLEMITVEDMLKAYLKESVIQG